MVKTPCFQCRGVGLIPGQGTNAAWYGQKKEITLGIELILLLVKAGTNFFNISSYLFILLSFSRS